jgi:alkanesulfonate monooxygenase SsuD/methylene tetrahydromethanopterin reductase-like flavin-dependent oxidoreductase (luciferase family)
MAARTRTIPVGVLVFDIFLRHPFMLAGAVAVAQAVSGGRVSVGIGIGDKFSMLDHAALSIPFPSFGERARFLEACCISLPRLWLGDTVTDPLLGLREAALGSAEEPPPSLIVGGGSRTLMELAVRYAQGWNLFTQDPETFAARVAVLAQIETAIDRREKLPRSVYFFVESAGRDLRKLVQAFEAVGADELMLVVRNPSAESILDLARQCR